MNKFYVFIGGNWERLERIIKELNETTTVTWQLEPVSVVLSAYRDYRVEALYYDPEVGLLVYFKQLPEGLEVSSDDFIARIRERYPKKINWEEVTN